MPTLWFSYSSGAFTLDSEQPLNSPYSLTWNVGRMLRERAAEHGYDFKYINLDSVEPVEFSAADVAVGHLWDTPGSFIQQALSTNIKAKIVLQPYSHQMVSPGDIPRYIEMFQKADALLFVTGEYWYQTMLDSPFSALYPKVTRLDMAVSTALHPYSKTRWNKPGERAACVIGHDTPTKGYKNVAELARVAGFRLGHYGNAERETFEHVPCMTFHGGMLFTPENIAALCKQYDALLCMPIADANPTVLLEAAAWGLSVFCTQYAGYLPAQPFGYLVQGDMRQCVERMRQWQCADEYDLIKESMTRRKWIEQEYTFEKMCRVIWSKVSEFL
jgi:hypothetical protein